jgi:hypothetical protein
MGFVRVEKMGEHKRNPTAIYFKENPWAPDFRAQFGKQRPRGKGIRRVYKILMELEEQREAKSAESGEGKAEPAEAVKDSWMGEPSYQIIKFKGIKNLHNLFRYIFLVFKKRSFLSPFRLPYLPLVKRFKNV